MPSCLPLLTTSLVNSIQIGSLYALMALGITLTFSVMKLPNFAHADYFTAGAYAALIVSLSGAQNPIVIMSAAFLVGALTAFLSHLAVFKPLDSRQVSLYTLILASFAVGLIIRYILFTMADYFNLFDLRIGIPLQILYREGFLILSNRLRLGRANHYRAGDSPDAAAECHAIRARNAGAGQQPQPGARHRHPVERVKNATWLLVGGLAGVAGALWSLQTAVNPLMGWGCHYLRIRRRHPRRLVELFRHDPRRLCGRLFGKYGHALPQLQLRPRSGLQAGDTLHHHHRRAACYVRKASPSCSSAAGPAAMINIDIGATAIAILTLFGIYSLMAISLNLEYGVAGVPNFGQALFVSIGAYTAGITYTRVLPAAGRLGKRPPLWTDNGRSAAAALRDHGSAARRRLHQPWRSRCSSPRSFPARLASPCLMSPCA